MDNWDWNDLPKTIQSSKNGSSSLEPELRQIIDSFNSQFNVEAELLKNGYSQDVGSGRWLHPNSSSGMAGLKLYDNNKWWSYNTTDPLCTGTPIDKFDIFCILSHNGKWGPALKEVKQMIGYIDPVDVWSKNIRPPVISTTHNDEPDRPPKPLTYKETINQPPKEWLINNQIGSGDLCMLFGDSGIGKTFIMLDWVLECAKGGTLMEDDNFNIIRPLKVLYITDEGNASFGQRVEAIGHYKGIHNQDEYSQFADNWLYLSSMLNVYEQGAELTRMEKGLTADGLVENKTVNTPFGWLVQDLNDFNFQPEIIVIDTLANATGGSNEIDNSDAHTIAKNIKAIKTYFNNCIVIFIHHTGKGRKDPRGASAYKQHCDAMWYVEQDENNRFGSTVSSFKIKDAEKPVDKYCLREKLSGWAKPYIKWAEQSEMKNDLAMAEREELINIIAANENIDIKRLMLHTNKGKKYLDLRLLQLELDGIILKTGKGVRGDPIVWNIKK